MAICPKCGKIADYNSYFGAYVCNSCSWKDSTPDQLRLSKYRSDTNPTEKEVHKQYTAGRYVLKI